MSKEQFDLSLSALPGVHGLIRHLAIAANQHNVEMVYTPNVLSFLGFEPSTWRKSKPQPVYTIEVMSKLLSCSAYLTNEMCLSLHVGSDNMRRSPNARMSRFVVYPELDGRVVLDTAVAAFKNFKSS